MRWIRLILAIYSAKYRSKLSIMVFLHADALRLPFREKSFDTIISENLLHCLADTKSLLMGRLIAFV